MRVCNNYLGDSQILLAYVTGHHYHAEEMCQLDRGDTGVPGEDDGLACFKRVATLHNGLGAVVYRARAPGGVTFIVKRYLVHLMGLHETEVMRREVRVHDGVGMGA